MNRILIVVLCLAARFATGGDSNWPQWRGPQNNGSVVDSETYPIHFSDSTNVLWKADLPGKGCSTPIVWNQCLYLTAPVEKSDAAMAFDWSGKLLWTTTLGPERAGKNQNGSSCNPSPITDGQRLYVHFKSGTVAALDLNGKVLWKLNLIEKWGEDTLYWDYGSSPVLTKNDVIIPVMQAGTNSYVAAFNKVTGELHWKVPRLFKTALEGDHSYATPVVFQHDGKEAILVWGGAHLTEQDASTGAIIWSCGDFNPKAVQYWPAVASPIIVGDLAIVPYARGETLHGIKLGGQGDVTATHRKWLREKTGAFVPTPSEFKGLLYVLRDEGQVDCIEPSTGETLWRNAFPKDSSKYYGSPAIANGILYAVREDGVVYVARVTPQFEIQGMNDMGERMIASPVPVEGRIMLRGEKHLFCIK